METENEESEIFNDKLLPSREPEHGRLTGNLVAERSGGTRGSPFPFLAVEYHLWQDVLDAQLQQSGSITAHIGKSIKTGDVRLDNLFQSGMIHAGLAWMTVHSFTLERLERMFRARWPGRVEGVERDRHIVPGLFFSFVIPLPGLICLYTF